MNEIPIVLFSVKDKENALFFDAYSQTDVMNQNSSIAPREYSNYYRLYVNKYKNYNSVNKRSIQSENDDFEQKINFSNKKDNICACGSNKYIELEGSQLKNGVSILPHMLSGNEFNQNLDEHGIQNFHIINYVNNQNSNFKSPLSSSRIHNIHLNNPYLNTRKIYTKYPSKQSIMSERYHNIELCRQCKHSPLKSIDFYTCQPPKYNFISNSIPEALTMTIMIGVNTVVEIIASIAVKFCARIPDKDELYPGTGCVLMDYLNDKIDHLLNDQIEVNSEPTENKILKNEENSLDVNCETWINNKLDEIMNHSNYRSCESRFPSKYNSLYDALIKNCYHKADESGFDPIKYSENLPYTLPFVNTRMQSLKRGFLDYPEANL